MPDSAEALRRPRRPRPLTSVTSEQLARATHEMVGLVRAELPRRAWNGEGLWRLTGQALVARTAGIAESIGLLIPARRPADTSILIRALFEHVTMFCWLAIDPERRLQPWADNSHFQMKRLHVDALQFGIQVLDDHEFAEAETRRELEPRLPGRAAEVDDYWATRIAGFLGHPQEGQLNVRTFRGMYMAIYRIASRHVHAQPESADPCVARGGRNRQIIDVEDTDELFWPSMAVPLLGYALLVCNDQFGWPDQEAVIAINNGLTTMPDDEAAQPGPRASP